jgi:hypothetical protein
MMKAWVSLRQPAARYPGEPQEGGTSKMSVAVHHVGGQNLT